VLLRLNHPDLLAAALLAVAALNLCLPGLSRCGCSSISLLQLRA
jgi:hypothetical protein